MDGTVRRHWGIVGGGILGMALAHRLAQGGEAVSLFEAAPHVGGLASAWSLGDVTWDRHYHVTLLSDVALRGLLRELNLEREMVWIQTRTGFYARESLISLSNSLEFLRFPLLNLIDKGRLAATILYASRIRDWKRLEGIPVGEWLARWSGRRTFDRIWLPLLRAKLGENWQKASAAFIWAIIARMYAARRTGLKREMFGYVPGGYARILERFAKLLIDEGVRLECASPARCIRANPEGRVAVEFTSGRQETFDEVVVTAAAPIAAKLCEGLTAEETRRLQGIQYQGVICASLLLEKPLAEYYVTNIVEPWVPFTAVIEMSALVDRKQFGGQALVYLPKYVVPDDPLFGTPDETLRDTFVAALERMYPHFRRDQVRAFQVSRVKYVLAISTLHYSDHLPPITTSVPGLHIVNNAHIVNGTLNVNETIQLAERTSAQFLSRRKPAVAAASVA